MGTKRIGRERELNELIRQAALANDGVLTMEQLSRLGLSRTMVQTRKETGRLLPILKGSFALPGTRLTMQGRFRAVLASVSDEVVLSRGSALALHGLIRDPGVVHLTGKAGVFRDPGGQRWTCEQFGLKVIRHETRHLPEEHLTEVQGIRLNTPERALRDYAAYATRGELSKALIQGEKGRLICWKTLRSIVGDSQGHRGMGLLRAAIQEWDPSFSQAASVPEIDFLEMMREAGMPKPLVNERVGNHIPDFLWRHLRLAVELDPYGTHSGKESHRRDHRKGIELEVAGLRVVRFTWEDRYFHEQRTAEELWTVLRQQATLLGQPLFPNGHPKW